MYYFLKLHSGKINIEFEFKRKKYKYTFILISIKVLCTYICIKNTTLNLFIPTYKNR